jgi:hypothetical protein
MHVARGGSTRSTHEIPIFLGNHDVETSQLPTFGEGCRTACYIHPRLEMRHTGIAKPRI